MKRFDMSYVSLLEKPKIRDGSPKKLVIDRSQWHRGNIGKPDRSALYTEGGRMCCLGFLGVACGYTKSELHTIAYPISASILLGKDLWPINPDIFSDGPIYSDIYREIALINDSEAIPESEREVRIKEAFKRIFDIDVEFVDGEENGSVSVSNGP